MCKGLVNCSNNLNHPEWNQRLTIRDLSVETLNKIRQKQMVRIGLLSITDIGILPLTDRCAIHRTMLKEGECVGCGGIPSDVVLNTQYNA